MDWLSILILAWVCVAIGYFGAGIVQNYRNRNKKEEVASPGDEATQPVDRIEIFRLWREIGAARMLPELDGEVFTSPEQLNADQHARVSMAMVDLQSWMGDGKVASPKAEPAAAPEPEQHPENVALETPNQADLEMPEDPADPETKPASMSFLKSLVHTAQSENKVPTEEQSIASQVDAILQGKIEGTDLEDQGLRLMDLPNQGMVIFVGLDKYQEIDEVPDQEIQRILKESVAEWEQRMLGASKKREAN